jgi:hypothetical protein
LVRAAVLLHSLLERKSNSQHRPNHHHHHQQKGSLIVEVPSTQWLTLDQARKWDSIASLEASSQAPDSTTAALEWEAAKWLSEFDGLAMWILVQQMRPFSPLAPWLRMVPLATHMHASPFWSNDELDVLQNSPLKCMCHRSVTAVSTHVKHQPDHAMLMLMLMLFLHQRQQLSTKHR